MRPNYRFAAYAAVLSFVALSSSLAEEKPEKRPDGGAGLKGKPPAVTLLDAGEEPRSRLRYRPEKGAREELVMTMHMDMSIEMNGNKLPKQLLPAQRVTMALEVADVAENGDITYRFTTSKVEVLENADVSPQLVKLVRETLAGLEGLTGEARVSARGILKDMRFEGGERLPPLVQQVFDSLKQSMGSLSNLLPEEAVGKGARWRVVRDMEMQGLRLRQTEIYRLRRVEESLKKLEVEIVQTAEPQDVRLPGQPPGTKLRLTSLAGKGKGTTTIDERRLAPHKSTLELESEAKMSVEVGGAGFPQEVQQRIKLKIDVLGKKPGE